jgi:hypothetical protein
MLLQVTAPTYHAFLGTGRTGGGHFVAVDSHLNIDGSIRTFFLCRRLLRTTLPLISVGLRSVKKKGSQENLSGYFVVCYHRCL